MTSETFGNLAVVRAIAAVKSAVKALHDWEEIRSQNDGLSLQAEWADELYELVAVERRDGGPGVGAGISVGETIPMTVLDAARRLGLSRTRVYTLLRTGQLGHQRIGPWGRLSMITYKHVSEYMKSCEKVGTGNHG
jgi:excisionase family DNA binding protein